MTKVLVNNGHLFHFYLIRKQFFFFEKAMGTYNEEKRLDGKTAIITGSNTGIGKFTAMDFARRGFRVVMACRNVEKGEKAKRDVLAELENGHHVGEILVKCLDLSSLRSVRNFAEEVLKQERFVHILVNNAGVMMCPKQKTEDGFEMQFGTNHLGHFLLTVLLLPRIIESAPSRIINVSSMAYTIGCIDFDDLNWEKTRYSPIGAYARSKLANVLFTRELAKRLKGREVRTYAVHPGLVRTELGRHMDSVTFPGFRWLYRKCFGWYAKTARQGAETTIHCAVDDGAGRETGLFYKDCEVAEMTPKAMDEDLAKKLWEVSWKMVELGDFNPFHVPYRK